jgi:2-succinyl-5-enolpyruvyl-6-hydroxy-3-cyclohexene-1-carboxylate synthase
LDLHLKAPNRNRFWADLIVEELVRNGVTTFFASPGSRSTPLVMAVYDHPECGLTMHFDERGSAFLALGYGKATQRPAVWITTSGTAVANGHPAVIEADLESTPMILLTADRPPELRDADANQAIRQDHIFGRSVRWFFDLPAPTDVIDPTFVLTTVDQAIFRSKDGPVHLNCMFREPLAPSHEEYVPIQSARFLDWESKKTPFTAYSPGSLAFSKDSAGLEVKELVSVLESAMAASHRPMIILGRLSGEGGLIARAAEALCQRIGAVFVADISSQARLGMESNSSSPGCGIAHIDILLASEKVREFRPDCVVQFGASPLSKKLLRLLSDFQPASYVVVDHRERRVDPSHIATNRLEADPVAVFDYWADASTGPKEASLIADRRAWQKVWKGFSAKAHAWLNSDVLSTQLTEQAAATILSRHLPPNGALTLGSSNSVRHMDSFGVLDGNSVPVLTNRGASGIDGTIASAVGFASGLQKRPIVFLGDLALLYDVNSLALCASVGAIVVVINNNGGGIFSYLPVQQYTASFEPLFGTPHGLGFESAAKMFGLDYANPRSTSDFEADLLRAVSKSRSIIIEIVTDRDKNVNEARRLNAALHQRLSSSSKPGTL